MQKKMAIFCLLLIAFATSWAQYKNDNVLYRLVYLQDLCKTMNENPGYLLLDVRSKGEYDDTSSFSSLNIGRFKNATNITIQELDKRLNEIKSYKDKPVFVYCSHSQRSRRASKMLADSGFAKVFNINSGMSSAHLLPAVSLECLLAKTELNTGYTILSPPDFCSTLIKNGKDLFLLDVRPDSIYNGVSGSEKMNMYGTIKGSIHIARSNLEDKISLLPQNKDIIVIDAFGDESAKAGKWLVDKGYRNISILFNGIDAIYSDAYDAVGCKTTFLEQKAPYKILSPSDFSVIIEKNPQHLLLDIRTREEFNNTSKDSWRNIGQLKDAVNIPATELTAENSSLTNYKNKPVIIYSFAGGGEDVFSTARKLTNAGFKDVNVLAGGLFNLRWAAHNIKGKEGIDDLVVNVPEVNW